MRLKEPYSKGFKCNITCTGVVYNKRLDHSFFYYLILCMYVLLLVLLLFTVKTVDLECNDFCVICCWTELFPFGPE